ncbi:MAG: class I SAM-dependent methyltransferase [Chitinispirillaceae bacterium]|nr:class I SAM-dependent methyltransferase [Chitinispirillaceae bacterium]
MRRNLNRFRVHDLVTVIVAPAETAALQWRGSCRIVFIDGAHDVLSVLGDFHQWLPHIRPGGFLLLHDSTALSNFSGPQFVAREKMETSSRFDLTGTVGSITWARVGGGDVSGVPHVCCARTIDRLLALLKRK